MTILAVKTHVKRVLYYDYYDYDSDYMSEIMFS